MIKKHYKKIFYLLPFVIAFVPYVMSILYFPISDDYILNFVSKGTYTGIPNEHIPVMNIIYGWLLKGLYTLCGTINWYAIMLLLFIIVSTLTLWFVIKKYLNFYLAMIVSLLTEVIFVCWISFTTVAYFVTAIAIIKMADYLLINNKITQIRIGNIISITFLFVAGLMLRPDAWKSGIILLVPVVIFAIIKNKNYKKLLILFLIMSSCSAFCILININVYNQTMWINCNEWREARSATCDYPITNYNDDNSIYKKIGYSKNDFEGLRRDAYQEADLDVYSTKNMKYIAEKTPFNIRYNLNILQIVLSILKLKEFWVFLIIVIGAFIFNKQNWIFYLIQSAFTLGIVSYLFFIQRPMQRVYMPIIIIGALCIMYMSVCQRKLIKEKKYKIQNITTFICLLAGIALVSLYGKQAYNVRNYSMQRESKYKEIREYIKSNTDILITTNCQHNITMNQPINKVNRNTTYTNLLELSSYELYNDTYYKKVDEYNLKYKNRLLIDLVENSNIYYLDLENEYVDHVITYLREHTNKKIKKIVVKKFNVSNSTVYKFEYAK